MDIAAILGAIVNEMRGIADRGVLPGYIPPLTQVDPQRFGMAVTMADGRMHVAGDADEAFSIQSISKVYALMLALETCGDPIWQRVRQEPSGTAFNSIVQLESEHGIPRNPFINAGALVIADILLTRFGAEGARARFLQFIRDRDDALPPIAFDEDMARVEYESGFRNAALANYMRTFGNIENPVDAVLKQYFLQCSVTMSCRQLAGTGRGLMRGRTAEPASRHVPTVLALMMMCGHYDGSGAFAVRVGLPGKSGVGGGILAIVPGIASIAVWSPGLNAQGNSLLGTLALEKLVRATGWSVFTPHCP